MIIWLLRCRVKQVRGRRVTARLFARLTSTAGALTLISAVRMPGRGRRLVASLDALFLDVLPKFDWAASEAGVKKLVGQFDSAAKSIAGSFGANVGDAAKKSTDQIAN